MKQKLEKKLPTAKTESIIYTMYNLCFPLHEELKTSTLQSSEQDKN